MKLIGIIILGLHMITDFCFTADIPFFKQVVVMATLCEVCGFRSNEVKSGAGVSEKGIKISLRITDPSDLSRDVLKVSIELGPVWSHHTHSSTGRNCQPCSA